MQQAPSHTTCMHHIHPSCSTCCSPLDQSRPVGHSDACHLHALSDAVMWMRISQSMLGHEEHMAPLLMHLCNYAVVYVCTYVHGSYAFGGSCTLCHSDAPAVQPSLCCHCHNSMLWVVQLWSWLKLVLLAITLNAKSQDTAACVC